MDYFCDMPDVIIGNQRFYNPVDYVFKKIGSTWKIPVLWRLKKNARRYSELQKDIPHISQKMLTKALKELEAAGLISKTVYAEVPPRVLYQLTDKGQSLVPLIETIRNTGLRLMKEDGIDYEQLIQEEKKARK